MVWGEGELGFQNGPFPSRTSIPRRRQGPREKKLRLADVKQMFLEMRDLK
jgi:hypothetical protein